MVAAEIEAGDHCAGNEHVDILCKQEKTEFHGAVFRVVTADQFRFAFRHIEGGAVAFGQGADKENDKTQWLIQYIPAETGLLLYNGAQTQRAAQHDHRNEGKSHRQFVRNHL